MQPAIIVKGIDGGAAGIGKSRNIIQPCATASLNIRLVPGQTPNTVTKQLIGHFIKVGYNVTDEAPTTELLMASKPLLYVQSSSGYPAYRSKMDGYEAIKLSNILKGIDGKKTIINTYNGR